MTTTTLAALIGLLPQAAPRSFETRTPSAVDALQQLVEALTGFKELMWRLDRDARAPGGAVAADCGELVVREFGRFCRITDELLGPDSPIPADQRAPLGLFLQKEFLPYLLSSSAATRIYTKPRGYAGDYLTIDALYENRPRGRGTIGRLFDRAILNQPVGDAVRNRRDLLAGEIADLLETTTDGSARITSLACGPAREVFDAFERIQKPGGLHATLVDFDLEALSKLSDEAGRRSLRRQIELVHANLVHVADGRHRLHLPPQDLVYSVGLIDYFDDSFVIELLDAIHGLLAPGGKVILGNFHERSPGRGFMDHVLEWKLVYRTEADMLRLFAASKFGNGDTTIRFEEAQINMFAECVKAP